ncbi:hypothetical protein B0J11DRAFT_611808 [Dendryphion nanum]|uniref:Polyketide synthase n=1 Tax=Dendryphion nanum TaxID=256645 RepID=A0A9P9EF21_9PLEO|nr:hypothetical protein B0J11DRAFT_611808 [Dendryphion nanum]
MTRDLMASSSSDTESGSSTRPITPRREDEFEIPSLDSHPSTRQSIAVVGMGCRLPGSVSSPSDLWKLLEEKRMGYKEFDSSRFNIDGFYHPNAARPASVHTRGGHLLDCDPHLFDHSFFAIQPSEVLTLDPMQRKLLEVCYEALESAGEPWEKFSGSRTGVFVGNFCTDYYLSQMSDVDFAPQYTPTGAGASILSNRINHVFNLKGPSMTIDTACASSMYALHLAVNAIKSGDCDAALVGGTNIILGPEGQQLIGLLGALSGTSLCHTFDEAADGYSRAEGFCALYLRRYSDAVNGEYPIRAVIRGTAVNSNGKTAGISHPSSDGQEALIRQAYKNAGLPTHLTGYFECHGTGTPVGDPIEVSAIAKVFSEERKQEPLLIGSVKTNLGHSEGASGITGVMKAILALEKGLIPATVGIQRLKPSIDWEGARVKVVTEMTPWPKDLLRRASVNSFGYGGANGHCIIDHPDTFRAELLSRVSPIPSVGPLNRQPTVKTRRLLLLPFSAHDQDSLTANIVAYQEAISSLPLADVAYTLANRRSKFLHKTFSILDTTSPTSPISLKSYPSSKTGAAQSARVGFVFTGQGAQWRGMGKSLFEYEVFRTSIERQDAVLAALSIAPSWTLRALLDGESDRSVQDAEVSQTICTALQIALVDLLRSWGISPHATVGHSSGEMAATYAAGRLSLEEAIITAYCRGRSISSNTQKGAMMAVGLGTEEAMELLLGLEASVKIAAVNSPRSVTLSGDEDSIALLHKRLQSEGVFARLLQTGGNAYHSHHMMAVGEKYETMLEGCLTETHKTADRLPPCHWSSSVTPNKLPEATPSYWRRNLQSVVRFSSAVEKLVVNRDSRVDILVEIGPHSALQSPIKQILSTIEADQGIKQPSYLSALRRSEDGMNNLLSLCGSLFQLNHNVDLVAVNSVDSQSFQNHEYLYGKVCTTLPTYRYSYGPVIFYEARIAREVRQRKHLPHDLLGVLKAGCSKDQPMWRNVLRLKHVPWLNHHQLIPNAVLPGASYAALGIEAASQFIGDRDGLPRSPMFKLRNIVIKNALRIPDNDIGIEMVTNLHVSSFSKNWLEFTVTSVDCNGTWTDNASGLVCIVESPHVDQIQIKRLDARMDPRHVDVNGWYNKFTEMGLGYGESFRGMSNLLTDPYNCVASAKLALNITTSMFTGPESKYAVHPASLDACFQLTLIALYGGHLDHAKNAFIPVSIGEMTVWPSREDEECGQALAQAKMVGLRGAHGRVQLFNQSGQPRVDVKDLRCVSYYGGTGKNSAPKGDEYTRLAWKPDASGLSTLNFSSKSKHAPEQPFASLIDLMGHRDPGIRILQVGASNFEITRLVLQTLGGRTNFKRYSAFTLTDSDSDIVRMMRKESTAYKNLEVHNLDITHLLETQDIDGQYDLIIVNGRVTSLANSNIALTNLRDLLRTEGRIILLEPELNTDQWQPLLFNAGFSGVDIKWTNDEEISASGLASTAATLSNSSTKSTKFDSVYIVYQNQISQFHESLADELRSKSIVPIIVALSSSTGIPDRSRVIVAIDLEPGGLPRATKEAYQSLKPLSERASSLLWLTKGAIIDAQEPEAAIATGLMRVLASEVPESRFGVFHLENDFLSKRHHVARVVIHREERFRNGDPELELALHDGIVYIPRLIYDSDMNDRFKAINDSSNEVDLVELPIHFETPMAIDFSTPGLLTSAYFKRDDSVDQPLLDDYVEIKTAAIGLNWKDIASSTGRNDVSEYSCEAAGTIVACGSGVSKFKPGDRVYGLAFNKFATRIRTPAGFVQLMSPDDDFKHMSSVPVAYCTATYGLLHLARLKKGDKVLIQSATGGLGLTAIQIARYCNADVYVTVGAAHKAEYLRDNLHIPDDHIFLLRNEEDTQEILAATGGKGFNVILSTTVGDLMHATWRCIAPRGHFIDVGRLDAQKRSTIGMDVFENNATFSSFDLSIMAKQDPQFCSQLMEEVGTMLRAGTVKPISEIQTFDVSHLSMALLAFSQGKHIGKLVVSYENSDSLVKTLPILPRATFDHEAMYIFVGGLGGLGRAMLRWFVERGARYFTILSRSGSKGSDAQITIRELEAAGARLTLKAVDVTSETQVDMAIGEVACERPVKGILHAAAGFDTQAFQTMPYEEWRAGLAAKVEGTANLHKASISHQLPLDFFLMTSSIQAVFGFPCQAAYCAGNAFQDAFARHRRSLGLPATSIAFGLITEISRSGEADSSRALMRRNQLYLMGERDFLQVLEGAFLEIPESHEVGSSWRHFDPLAGAQIMAYGDPRKIADEFKNDDPKWRSDSKFAHIVRATQDRLSTTDTPEQVNSSRPAIVATVDASLEAGKIEDAVRMTAQAIAERTASLLAIEVEAIDLGKSVAEYGIDSLIAVELRSWIVATFESTLPLLKLLDEHQKITDLATGVVDERLRKIGFVDLDPAQ